VIIYHIFILAYMSCMRRRGRKVVTLRPYRTDDSTALLALFWNTTPRLIVGITPYGPLS